MIFGLVIKNNISFPIQFLQQGLLDDILPDTPVQLSIKISFEYLNNHTSKAIFHKRFKCIAYARLDDTKNLYESLNIPIGANYSSSEIILESYLKWGKDCVSHLLGDWSFAIWDNHKKELFIARDPIGYAQLFYYDCPDYFIFSSDLKTLLAHTSVPKVLNSNAIFQQNKFFKKDNQTFYKGIFRLISGHHLTVSSNKFELKNYWLPIKNTPIRYKNDKDYVEHFLELYNRSIEDRLGDEKTGLLLSSGLDSTSILALLSPIAEKKGQNIATLTWQARQKKHLYVPSNSYFSDEVTLAKEFTQQFSNIDFKEVIGKENNIINAIKKWVNAFQQPEVNNIMMSELFEIAQSLEIKTIMTGYGGNFNVSYAGSRVQVFKELMLTGQWNECFNLIKIWQKNQRMGWPKTLMVATRLPFNTNGLKEPRIKMMFQDIIRPQAVNEQAASFELNLQEFNTTLENSGGTFRGYLINMIGEIMGNMNRYANSYGIECRTPTMDKRLIEFCLNIPERQFAGQDQHKWLLKRAMKDKIPSNILYNTKRGVQGGDIIQKYKLESKSIAALLDNFKQSPLVNYWLTIEQLEKKLEFVKNGNYTINEFFATKILSRGLTLGLFLLKFEREY